MAEWEWEWESRNQLGPNRRFALTRSGAGVGGVLWLPRDQCGQIAHFGKGTISEDSHFAKSRAVLLALPLTPGVSGGFSQPASLALEKIPLFLDQTLLGAVVEGNGLDWRRDQGPIPDQYINLTESSSVFPLPPASVPKMLPQTWAPVKETAVWSLATPLSLCPSSWLSPDILPLN